MSLFEIIDGRLVVSEHALIIEPFGSIWEADTTLKKEHATKVFKYTELLCSPKKSNPFFGYSEDDRPARVKKEIFKDPKYPDTAFMIQSVMKFKELLENSSPSYSMLNTGLVAKEKLEKYLQGFDMDERTPGGAMVIKPADITKALRELPEVAKGIETMLEKIKYEMIESSKTRNQREIGEYER